MNTHPDWDSGLSWLLNHSWQAGLLVLLVLGVQTVFRGRLTNRWRFALWWIVLARLLLPFNPASTLSLFNYLSPTVRLEQPHTAMHVLPENNLTAMMNPPAAVPLPTPAPSQTGESAMPAPPTSTATTKTLPPITSPAPPKSAMPPHPFNFKNDLVPGLIATWLLGVLVLAGIILAQVWRFKHKLARAVVPGDAHLQGLLDDCRREFGITRQIALRETSAVASPALFGFWRLQLLLPRGIGHQFNEHELRYIFLHELAHVKRGDLWLNWLVAVLQTLHWFNPLLWFGFARLRADRELACDELALLRAGDQAGTAYGETVVKLLEHLNRPTAIPGLIGILEDKNQMRRRILMIANFRKPGRWSLLAALLVVAIATVALTDAPSTDSGKIVKKTSAAVPALKENSAVETNYHNITVTVLDEQTGQPISGARVAAPYLLTHGTTITRNSDQLTDEQGTMNLRVLRIPNEGMQNFSISVNAPNYPARSVMWISDAGKVLETLPDSYTFRLAKGISVGGYVRDEHGQPLAGVKVIPWGSGYRGFTMGTGQQLHQEYPEVSRKDNGGIITDAQGFWRMEHFPADLTAVRLDVVRPGGGHSQFTTETDQQTLSVEQALPVSLSDLLMTNLVLAIPDGYPVQGVFVDAAGRPVTGVRIKARGGQVEQTPSYITTNNTDGTFKLEHWNVPQFVLTAEADGFATKTVTLSAADAASEKQIVLSPAQPLRVRVLGEKDEPLAGAGLSIVNWRSGNQLLDWNGTTDAHGLVVWTNAPELPVTFWVQASNYPVRAVKLLADGTEKTVHLRPGSDKSITVHLKVADAESGEPITSFEVRRDMQYGRSMPLWGDPGTNGVFQAAINSGEFQLGIVDYFKLQVDADKYLSWASDELYFDEGDQSLTVKLAKGSSPAGFVRQPDGAPAANARVVLCQGENASVFFNAPNQSYPGQGSVTVRSAEDGSFHFEGAADDKYVVASHPSGFATATVSELKQTKELRLQAWASLEGVMTTNGQPVAGENVSVQAPVNWEALEGFNLVYSATTDADGHFAFTNLPAGDYVLYRQPHIIYGVQTQQSHRRLFALKPGEHKHIDYTFGGRQVVGHVETEVPVDWQNDAHLLVLKTPPGPTPPSYWSYVSKEDYYAARKAFAHSPELLAYEHRQQQFQLVFDDNGNFHADDVPPGNYELRLNVTKPPKNDQERYGPQREQLGTLMRDVQVPAGEGAFDVGALAMKVKANGLPTEPAKMVELAAKDFKGQDVTLKQFQGKYTVLVFWASWSDRSLEQLAEVAKLQSVFGQNEKFAVLGVNLDGQPDEAQKLVAARGYAWPQSWLDEPGRAKATAAFSLESLPSFCLVGPEGQLVARDLKGEVLHDTVQRVLKSN